MADRLHNRYHLKHYRKDLRNYGTSAEAVLWNSLKCRALDGRKFRRQHSIQNMIVDFFCYSEKLIIELDGDLHYTDAGLTKDGKRDNVLNNLGFTVLRFENDEVLIDLDAVLKRIWDAFSIHPKTPNFFSSKYT